MRKRNELFFEAAIPIDIAPLLTTRMSRVKCFADSANSSLTQNEKACYANRTPIRRPGICMRSKLVLIATIVLVPNLFHAQGFCGRPLVIDDAQPVAPGQVETEAGLSFARPATGGRDHGIPSLAVAYGLARDWEVGLGLQRASVDRKKEEPIVGWNDLHVTAKYNWLVENESRPAVSFSLDIKIPTANRRKGLSTGKVDENFVLLLTKEFAKVGFDLNLGYLHINSPPRLRHKNRVLSGIAARWTLDDKWTAVGEMLAVSRETKGENNRAEFQTGFCYQANPQLTLDAAAGRSLRSGGIEIKSTIGLTWTFAPTP